ncbi:tRNA (adenosine(37)-N6)-threonylcarbamoyltransferase complex dimerization subunit type 1 TsaB [Vibrio methylphosphonaticus]|uniref:tRNA (adenosine(37)-N6)-threonylcarbamoyltransferase complex dimerization subunit type 1 TsaB n=1 Tax=Vibrio methylphosphonaticus TaxID=2946866 RepID=UPI00202A9DC7|nr:tRNA (adenosine(37)-N6)-threonylcarbamoyltransferase complex dimerization subunit type 1 TsaB [Vibrio methylphosphonaticus]MCL9773198.1 tRNA (adenosine(37)-N6)-threonylcarbamoyltransferase complex dimerization subunit type 1 TsaB [Vibrio methylphosphonaticus]
MTNKILAIDTATENCSVALLVGDKTYARSELAPRDHTKKVLPMVDELLNEAGLTLQDLDALAFARGPGSFTGVRICIGVAQGLGFGADLPMIGISTLKAMAQGAYRKNETTNVATAIDARMSEVYWGRFERLENGDWTEVEAEQVVAPDTVVANTPQDGKTWATAGTGWEAYTDSLSALAIDTQPSGVLYPEAEDIAFLAQYELAKGNVVAAEEASPVYLRDNVTWKKLPGRE